MARYVCTVAHEVPLGGGRFQKFAAGQECTEAEIGDRQKYFELISAAPEKAAKKKTEVKEDGRDKEGLGPKHDDVGVPEGGDV